MRKTAPRPGAPAARSPRSPGTAAPRCEARRRRESGGEGRSYGRKLPTLPQSLERKQKRRQEGQGGEAHHTPDLGPPDSKSEARRTDMRNRALTLLASSTSESVKQRAEVFIQKHQVAIVLPEKPQATQALGDDSKPAAVPPDSAPDPSKEEVPSAQPAAKAETSAGTTAPVETQLAQIQRGIFWIFSCVFTCLPLNGKRHLVFLLFSSCDHVDEIRFCKSAQIMKDTLIMRVQQWTS